MQSSISLLFFDLLYTSFDNVCALLFFASFTSSFLDLQVESADDLAGFSELGAEEQVKGLHLRREGISQ